MNDNALGEDGMSAQLISFPRIHQAQLKTAAEIFDDVFGAPANDQGLEELLTEIDNAVRSKCIKRMALCADRVAAWDAGRQAGQLPGFTPKLNSVSREETHYMIYALAAVSALMTLYSFYIGGRLKRAEQRLEIIRIALERHLETGDDYRTPAKTVARSGAFRGAL